MPKLNVLLLLVTLLLPGCALFSKPVPVAASCPPPPPAPQAVIDYASPATNLIDDSATLLLELRRDLVESLQKASGLSM